MHRLHKKAQDHKDSVKAEIQERNKVTEEISAVTNALQNAASVLLQDADGKAEQLEVGNSSVIVTFRISGLCWCLNFLQIKLMARSMHIDLKTMNLAQQNRTGPPMLFGLCFFPSVGICKQAQKHFQITEKFTDSCIPFRRGCLVHTLHAFPSAYLPRAAPDALDLVSHIGG